MLQWWRSFFPPSCSCDSGRKEHTIQFCAAVFVLCGYFVQQNFCRVLGVRAVSNGALNHGTLTRYSCAEIRGMSNNSTLIPLCLPCIQQPLADLGTAQLQLNLDLSVAWTKPRCLPSLHSKDPVVCNVGMGHIFQNLQLTNASHQGGFLRIATRLTNY